MPQETNLNVAPYFDDFDTRSNYCKILFKPGLPVQARELTGIQSILQDQIEKFGSHVFKEGASVTGGGIRYNGGYTCVRIKTTNEGIDVADYLDDIAGQVIIGSESGVKAKIKDAVGVPTGEDWYILFIGYLNTGGVDNEVFLPGESLLLDDNIVSTSSGISFQPGEPIAQVADGSVAFTGAAAVLSAGIYFVRGYFVDVSEQTIILDPFSNFVDAKVGLTVDEDIITPELDESLTDNAAGYNNYTAPGADRLSLRIRLVARDISDAKPPNFINLMEIRGGNLVNIIQNTKYNELGKELASRTFEESGNYYVSPYSITARNTLNDYEGNNGIFNENQQTYNGQTPSEDLGTYKISPGKAYVEGYAVETISPLYLDFNKPRTTKTLENQNINYITGPTFTLNRVSGSPRIGVGTDYTVSLRDQRIGAASTTAAGKEIGLARVFDFALESGSYDSANADANEWDISLYDIQPYTNLTLNTNPEKALVVPTHIKGKSSGATGYLRYNSVGTAITAYNTKGKFITGEQLVFNGVDSGNVAAATTSYTTSDIKSINGTVSTASTFNADVKQSVFSNIGEVNISIATTSGAYLGISTVTFTDPTKFFSGIATVGNIVEYTNPGKSTVSYAKIESVSQQSLTISGVSSVTDICDGGLPTSIINPSNFKILTSQFQLSEDNNLYTKLPKDNISNVDLTNSHITIRKQYDVTITDNKTNVITTGNANEVFVAYDEEDYVLIRNDGTTESLSPDKFSFNAGNNELTINGLGTNSGAKLIATLTKSNVSEKIKEKQKINILTVVGSASSISGIGTTTLNDGLTYNTVYGTRVQDQEISLNVPDATKVYGILESNNASSPIFPVLSLTSINSATSKTGDLLIGEKLIGSDSKAIAVYVSKNTDSAINYIMLNDYKFQVGEIVTFHESGITANVGSVTLGSNNITKEFSVDNGQRNTIYDYSRIIRKEGYAAPTKRIAVVFESAYYTASDTGDITTVNSYKNFDYGDIPEINEERTSDFIDIRPRVSDFSGTARSPFEFLGRSFTSSGSSAANILASDGSILLNYSFYLPRLDKIYLNQSGEFQLLQGTPAEDPQWPGVIDGALDIASITLPPYLYDINSVSINLSDYKRYQMSDIHKLEKRIENLEFYTSLSLLESNTLNMQITDVDGLNRFKSGFFVDDFSTTDNQLKTTIVKNSIDYHNGELRPSPYTTELDLQLDLDSANNIKQTGRVLTLDYDHEIHAEQLFGTRVENVTPYLVSYYGGTITLTPDSDLWVDQVVLEAKNEDLTTYSETTEQLDQAGFDSRKGYSPVTWGAWTYNWTGKKAQHEDSYYEWRGNTKYFIKHTDWVKTGTKKRTGKRELKRETFSTVNKGPAVINTELSPYMRSRNIKFSANTMKPSTGIYAFFDGQDVSKYIIPKLIEISMDTGTFQVGETVIGSNSEGKELIRFKVAQSNHKYGPIDDPNTVYKSNPYYQFTPLIKGTSILVDAIVPQSSTGSSIETSESSNILNVPELYSSTSTLLNVDLDSLSAKSDNIFHGYIEKGLKLAGQTSNAQASISNVRLRCDTVGAVLGSFFVPNPNDITTPKFEVGKKVFRLTTSSLNSQVPGNVSSDASRIFEATGKIETLQSTIVSVKNIHTDIITRQESLSAVGDSSNMTRTTKTTIVDRRGGGGGGGKKSDPDPIITVQPDPTKNEVGVKHKLTVFRSNEQAAKISNTAKATDPIADAYKAEFGSVSRLTEGAAAYWSGTIAKELGKNASKAAVQARMVEHIKFQKKIEEGKVDKAKFIAAHDAKQVAQGKDTHAVASAKLAKEMGIEDGKTFSDYNKQCGHGKPDPLAQSIWVAEDIYATKLDLWFGSKDQFLPVMVQLRTMKTGLPTDEIIPFSEVILDPEDVNVSDDSSVVTTVEFPSPVYLPGNQSYAIVLLSHSNDYTAWISRMGEVDMQTKDRPEAEQVVVSSQPTLGSLFKSQNGETWNPSQYEDLKFRLYRASFKERTGSINFVNPLLETYSDDSYPLLNNSFEMKSNQIRIGFNTTISDTGITVGNIISQDGSNATGRLAGTAGTATGNLTITNAGVGYTPSSGSQVYSGVSLNTITGAGRNATANITITNGVAAAATIASGGSGYVIGDVVGITSVGINSLGRNIKFSIGGITGINEYVLDNVQGDFVTGVAKTFRYTTSAGIVTLNHAVGGNVWLSGDPVTINDGFHIKINQKNHGMYDSSNRVTFTDVLSDVTPTQLSADYDSSSTGSIIVNDASDFSEFENVGVGSTNIGYVKVGREILSYTGVTNNTLTGVVRGVDSTQTLSHSELDFVYKYELNGVSLRRINTTHILSNANISNPIGIDYYNVKVDMSANGVDRSVGTNLPKLHFNQTKSAGGQPFTTENIPFEIITPIVQNITPTGTDITAKVRTVTGSSVDGSEAPFVDKGFEDISIDNDNYMSSPRMIASRINETNSLTTLPDNKSFTMTLDFYGQHRGLSPIVDLDRIGVILTSNRINNPVDDWITDNRVNTVKDDPNSFVYVTKPISLKSGATGIKIHLEGHINVTSDIRAFYGISENPNEEFIYQPFPGYPNLLSSGQVIDPAKNSGLPDKALPKTDVIAYSSASVVWNDYEFTIDDLPTFKYFSIKLVGTGTNQAQPPRMKNLRVIALA